MLQIMGHLAGIVLQTEGTLFMYLGLLQWCWLKCHLCHFITFAFKEAGLLTTTWSSVVWSLAVEWVECCTCRSYTYCGLQCAQVA